MEGFSNQIKIDKMVGGWMGVVGWMGSQRRVIPPKGLFGVAMSPKTTSHRPRQAWRA